MTTSIKTVPCRPAGSEYSISALQALAQHQTDHTPFYLLDLGQLHRRMELFQNLLPTVKPHYAVKCLPDPQVIRALAALGAGFDCASQYELELVLGLDVEPSQIVFANACKPSAHIKYANTNNVNLMTFDNEGELVKIHDHHPGAQLLLRLAVDDSHSVCRLGLKYGAAKKAVPRLLQRAKDLDLSIVGVSFHVGSGCMSAQAYVDALLCAKDAMQQATCLGFAMTILDIGGGFPGATTASGVTQGANVVSISFAEIAATINKTLDAEFGDVAMGQLTVIAEPGRFFAASIMDLAVNVIARRVLEEEQHIMYYINDVSCAIG
jgi:ornithine decarboxylase